MKYSIFMYVYDFVQENLSFPNIYQSIMFVGPIREIFSAKGHGQGVAAVDNSTKAAWMRHTFLHRNEENIVRTPFLSKNSDRDLRERYYLTIDVCLFRCA